MQTKIIALLGAGLTFAAQNLHAQNAGANQLVDTAQQRRQLEQSANAGAGDAPELYAGEASDLGPQSVLKIKPRRWHLEAFGDAQYFYTDNMFLSDHVRQGADVLVSTVQAALVAPPLNVAGGRLASRVGYQHQWFTYGLLDNDLVNISDFKTGISQAHLVKLNTFDFNAQTFFGDVSWSRDNWTVTAGFDYRRLLDSGNYDEFYHEAVPNWGVQKTFNLAPKLTAAAGYQGDYRFTDSARPPANFGGDLNDRTDHSLFATLNFNACKYAVLQPFYRFQFTHYTAENRDDYLNSFGIALYFPITKNISLRTFLNYDLLNTDGVFVQSYNKFDAGGGVNLNIRF